MRTPMGLDISSIIEAAPRKLADFSGWTVAVDAHNTIYQFLSSIRQPDGTPLMDRRGRVTSHLSGLLYRTASLLEAGIRPVFVFDGEPHPLKMRTLAGRARVRDRAREAWQEALAKGDLETARSKAQQSSRLTQEMVDQSTRLLELMGVPSIRAPGEGEAMASTMAARKDVRAVGSQDYDALLFGAPRLIRNLTLAGRRKLPRRRAYVTVEPALVDLDETMRRLELDREQLVDLGILVGTDFNEGIKGVGPKKALALIKKHGSAENVLREMGLEIEHLDEVRRIFLEPQDGETGDLSGREPDVDEVVAMLCGEFDFSEDRVRRALDKVTAASAARNQQSLDGWL
jgi:flap endonuclease-1